MTAERAKKKELTFTAECDEKPYEDEAANDRFAALKKAVPDFDLEMALKNCSGSEEFYIELLKDSAVPQKVTELEEAFAAKDFETYEHLIHAIKGSMRMFGFPELGNMAEGLQYTAERQDWEYLTEHHGAAAEVLSEIIKCAGDL